MSNDSRCGHARAFLKEIEPFLYGRPITYVDVGAYVGDVLTDVAESSLNVHTAHLIEPNPASFKQLQATVDDVESVPNVACHNVAISDVAGTLSLRDEGSMTRVIAPGEEPGGAFFEIGATTLDEFAESASLDHIDLLKVDVEGHELGVINGANKLLSGERIDVIYVEAGMSPESSQHAYYRDVEDALQAYGYGLFRVFEQTHQWPTDNPLLRRVNLCFMSPSFSSGRPYKLSRELLHARKAKDSLTVKVRDLERRVEGLEDDKTRLNRHVAEVEGTRAQLLDVEQRLRATKSERDAMAQYADELEAMFKSVLRSNSWRVTGPLRIGLRSARRALGKPAGGRIRLPLRPTPGARSELSSADRSPETVAAEVVSLVKAANYPRLLQLKRELEAGLTSDEAMVSYAFWTLAWARQTSTFALGAQAADGILSRYRERRPELLKGLSTRYYRRLITDAAVAYTRIGRYTDARELVDREIEAGLTELLPLRAEISWIHDPELAANDLGRHLRRVGRKRAGAANLLLQRHLDVNVLGHDAGGDSDSAAGESLLVDAIGALANGRHRDFRRLVNEFFGSEGHVGPLDDSGRPFSFEDLTAADPPSSAAGPLVSVIMTTFNASATLRYAVESVLKQTHRSLELLIVDDCSTDGTRQELLQLAQSDDRVRLIFNEQNAGTYAAKNRAMEVAQGSYVTFHDADDWAHPQRVQVHLDSMERDPGVVATRSMWLRVDPDGKIDFRRWQKRLAHPNPASLFVRSSVVEKIGYFDTVRFGADSEYWYRAQRVFGRNAVVGLRQCLGLGRHHFESLTRRGLGARDVEEYSAVRGAYQYSWFEWHAGADRDELRLEAQPNTRRFWAPDAMAASPAPQSGQRGSLAMCYPNLNGNDDTSTFVFGISLASAKASKDWGVMQRLLARTLRSVLNQSDGRWRAVVCGHERPDIPELEDPRVMFVVSSLAPPKNSGQFRKDKMWKRRLIGSILRNLGGGYFCPLDADDLVHRDLVRHVLGDDNKRGYRVDHGYVEDLSNERLAPVPGAWSAPFDRVCGSSAVLYFEADELPTGGEKETDLYFNLFQSHAYWPIVAEEWGRPLDAVPFPAAVYVVNHSQNLSFGLQRSGDRTANIVAAIERHAMDDCAGVLSHDYGQVLRRQMDLPVDGS